jgi:hypothetical protein
LLPDLIIWDDKELLFRVIEERFSYYFHSALTPDEIWHTYFANEIDGMTAKEFIAKYAVPRPRDIIFFLQSAISDAADRGHSTVQPQDFLSARRSYSQFAFDALIAEDDPKLGRLEDVLYEFAGAPVQLTKGQVLQRIAKVGLRPHEVDSYLNVLVELNFLGIKAPSGEYEFPQDDRRRRILLKIADGSETPTDDDGLFAISLPYHAFLEIASSAS